MGLAEKARAMSGKGSAPRPYTVDRETFASNWDRIFGKKPKAFTVTVPDDLPEAPEPETTDE